MTAFALTAIAAALACGLEMLEALAIVLAVGIERHMRDALWGAAAAAVACALLAFALGPLLLGQVAEEPLRVVIGVLLLLLGLEWLRKGVLRLAGRRARSSSLKEFVEEREALESLAEPEPGKPDWAGRAVAFKGVLLEGVEVILIVTALGARDSGLAPALLGAGIAIVAVIGVGIVLHRPLARLPETHLKYVVGVVLTSFGVFILGEGMRVDWPLGDAALLYIAATLAAVGGAEVALLARATRGPKEALAS
jgi:Ca2+/H+ antiporter, TMEM165/GDT1 family